MKRIIVSAFIAALATASVLVMAQTPAGSATPTQSCSIGRVSGVGGAARSFREYLASSNQYRYLSDHPLDCQVSDDGRTSNCVGVVNLRNDRVSVYDDSGDATISVVARVELDRGTYPVIIVVRRQDVRCEE